jgi:hypothetical protein
MLVVVYAECHIFSVMLSVTVLNFVMLIVVFFMVILEVVVLNFVILSVIYYGSSEFLSLC